MKKFLKEFKEFAMRGNVLDLAVGVIIGGAFQKIVTSLVGDIISPMIGLFGGANFDNLVLKVGQVELRYGAFLTVVLDFLIMALVIFLLVKGINKITEIGAKEKKIEEEKTARLCPYCCSEIAEEATRCPHCTSALEDK